MKRMIYTSAALFSLGALIGTAGASDFENIGILATFIMAVLWTSFLCVFTMLALYETAKKKLPAKRQLQQRAHIKSSSLVYPKEGDLSNVHTSARD